MMALSSIASADVVTSFTVTIGPNSTDLTNQLLQLTPWDPGNPVFTVVSDASWSAGVFTGSAPTGYVGGITMASLNTSGLAYHLQSYDIAVSQTLAGSWQATAGGSGSAGRVDIDSYLAVSLNATMGTLDATHDPANDLFNPSGGADPTSANVNVNFAPGGSTGTQTVNKTNKVGLGYDLANGSPAIANYTPITTGLGAVESSSLLDFYLSTLTAVNLSGITSGSVTTSNTTTVTDKITIVYDFTTTGTPVSTPEPATMALFGCALVALSVLRGRAAGGGA
jgi:hypothetical protein